MPKPPAFPLQVFYDGSCSLCSGEIEVYRRDHHAGRLIFVDISSPDFDLARHGIPMNQLMREMHAIDKQGRIYRGVETFRAIWHAFPNSLCCRFMATLVGLPGVNQLARLSYWFFARTRKYFPKRRGACDTGVCRRGPGPAS